MTWWYNTESGALTSSGSVQTFFQQLQSGVGLGAGWHQLPIPSTDTEAAAAAEAKKLYPAGTAPTTSVQTQVSNSVSQEATGSATGLAGLSQIGVFFSALGDKNTWIRVAKVIVGGVMLIVGLVHITGAGGAAADAARKVPLPV
jgi:hypothetical protein